MSNDTVARNDLKTQNDHDWQVVKSLSIDELRFIYRIEETVSSQCKAIDTDLDLWKLTPGQRRWACDIYKQKLEKDHAFEWVYYLIPKWVRYCIAFYIIGLILLYFGINDGFWSLFDQPHKWELEPYRQLGNDISFSITIILRPLVVGALWGYIAIISTRVVLWGVGSKHSASSNQRKRRITEDRENTGE